MPKRTAFEETIVGAATTDKSTPEPPSPPSPDAQAQYEQERARHTEAAAATPLDASWKERATEQAGAQYGIQKERAIADALGARQERDLTQKQAQDAMILRGYSDRQSAQRAGWTGGYVLDQERQHDYMKASIQAQFYGQKELEALGLHSALAAARLAYDLGKMELAHKHYMDQLSMQLAMAEVTGHMVLPEVRDMFEQRTAAQNLLDSVDLSDPLVAERADVMRAQHIIGRIDEWAAQYNISPQGFATLANIGFWQQIEQNLWERVEAARIVANQSDTTFLIQTADGQRTAETIDIVNASPQELQNFILNAGNGASSINTYMQRAFQGTIDFEINKFLAENNIQSIEDITDEQLSSIVDSAIKRSVINDLGTQLLDLPDQSALLKLTLYNSEDNTFSFSYKRDGITIHVTHEGVTGSEEKPSTDDTPTLVIDPDSFQGIGSQIEAGLDSVINLNELKYPITTAEARTFLENYYNKTNIAGMNLDEGIELLTRFRNGLLPYDEWVEAQQTLDPSYNSPNVFAHWVNQLEGFDQQPSATNVHWLPQHHPATQHVTLWPGYGSTTRANYNWQTFAEICESLGMDVEYHYETRDFERRNMPKFIKINGIQSAEEYRALLFAVSLVNQGVYTKVSDLLADPQFAIFSKEGR